MRRAIRCVSADTGYVTSATDFEHQSILASWRAGVMRIATWSLTVLHTASHIPHPTQAFDSITNRNESRSMASAFVGHFDTQAWQPCPAVQSRCETAASPIRTSPTPSTGNSASTEHAAIQGKSSHRRQGDRSAKMTGVPSCECARMAPGGQALMQSPHRVQRSRKRASSTAPGGRSQSWRTGGRSGAGAASR